MCSGDKSNQEEEEEDDDEGDEDDDDELHLEDSDTEAPCDDDIGPVLQVRAFSFYAQMNVCTLGSAC